MILSDTLNEQLIQKYCSPYFSQSLPYIHVLKSVDSTNEYLKNLPFYGAIELCCADKQTKGRGRLGRKWHSPAGENIYCSIRWQIQCPLSKLSALSLVTALAILQSLKNIQIHENIGIKWPNDLYWHGKKLGGILIETSLESVDTQLIVIGIGLNVNVNSSSQSSQNQLDRPWCSLLDITGKFWNRNKIIGVLLGNVHQYLQRYLVEGFIPFMPEWEKADCLYGQSVEITTSGRNHLRGIASGITEHGQLQLLDSQGKIHFIFSGEITKFFTSFSSS